MATIDVTAVPPDVVKNITQLDAKVADEIVIPVCKVMHEAAKKASQKVDNVAEKLGHAEQHRRCIQSELSKQEESLQPKHNALQHAKDEYVNGILTFTKTSKEDAKAAAERAQTESLQETPALAKIHDCYQECTAADKNTAKLRESLAAAEAKVSKLTRQLLALQSAAEDAATAEAKDAATAEAKATRQLELQQTKRSELQGRLDEMDTREVVVLVAHKVHSVDETVQRSKTVTNAALTSLETQVKHLREEMQQMKTDFWRGFSERGVLQYFKRVSEAKRSPSLNFVGIAHNWDMWDLVADTLGIEDHPAKHLQIPLATLKAVGATALQARRCGFCAEDVRKAGYSIREARAGGYARGELSRWLKYPVGLKHSKIVDTDMWLKLGMMLPAHCREEVSLVVEGVRSPEWFDAVMRGKRNVLVVVQDDRQQVFGGFCADRLGHPGGWIVGNRDNFLFTLGKHGRGSSSKVLSKDGSKSVHVSGCGLHFGNGANQLVVYDEWFFHPCSPTYTEVDPEFDSVDMSSCPKGRFLPQLVEVYECM